MGLKGQITDAMKQSMKAGEKKRTSVLRMLLSEIKYAQSAVNAQEELADEEVLKVLKTYHKRLLKAREDFPVGEKQTEISAEMAIVEEFMPAMLGEDEVQKLVDKILASTEERSFGVLMKQVMAEAGDAADGKMISGILKQKLSNS